MDGMADPHDDRLAALEARIARLEGRLAEAAEVSPPRPPGERAAAREAKLGTYWLSRLGVVSWQPRTTTASQRWRRGSHGSRAASPRRRRFHRRAHPVSAPPLARQSSAHTG